LDKRYDDLELIAAKLTGDRLVGIATQESNLNGTRCICFPGFSPPVVERLVGQLLTRFGVDSQDLLVRVDDTYRGFIQLPEGTNPEKVFLAKDREHFTTYRNQRRKLTVLVPQNALGEERESQEAIETWRPDDIRGQVEELFRGIEGGRNAFGDEYEGLLHFFRMLVDIATPSLGELVRYICRTRQLCGAGELVTVALGEALPELGAFRHRLGLRSLDLRRPDRAMRWGKTIERVVVQGRDYSLKRDANGNFIAPEELQERFNSLRSEFEPNVRAIIQGFVDAPAMDKKARSQALPLDWQEDRVELLFHRPSRERGGLGRRTRNHLEFSTTSGLTGAERQLMEEVDRRPELFQEEHDRLCAFYEKYDSQLSPNRTLVNQWERRLFGQDTKDSDFLVALLKVASDLVRELDAAEGEHLKLRVLLDMSQKTLLEKANRNMVEYFGTRYCGLAKLLEPWVELCLTNLLKVRELDQMYCQDANDERLDDLRSSLKKYHEQDRPTTGGNELHFKAELIRLQPSGACRVPGTERRLTWTFPFRSFLAGLPEDLRLHSGHPLRFYELTGSLSTVATLGNPECVEPNAKRQTYCLTSRLDSETVDIRGRVSKALSTLQSLALVSDSVRGEVLGLTSQLERELLGAYEGFLREGLAWQDWESFASRYGHIIGKLADIVRVTGQRFAREALSPVLLAGVTFISTNDTKRAVVTPLHPLRLISVYVAAHQTASVISGLLDRRLGSVDVQQFVRQLKTGSHCQYPELMADDTDLFAIAEDLLDYSLFCSVSRRELWMNPDPREAAGVLVDVIKDHVSLYPHKKTNLSILLHSVSCGDFPRLLIGELAKASLTDLNGVRFRLTLKDQETTRLQHCYAQLISILGGEEADETDLSFLSWLEITAIKDANAVGISNGDLDIAFLLDKVASYAELRWRTPPKSIVVDALALKEHYPARWSRRRPSDVGQERSSSYLSCPANPSPVSQYYRAVGACANQDYVADQHALPVREVPYHKSEVRQIVNESHRLAKWVVSFDSLLDRRQLEDMGVQVIRYRPARGAGPNLIVSSRQPDNVARGHLKARIRQFSLVDAADLDQLVSKVIEKANKISGRLVLAATGRGYFTNELLGAVLSALILEQRIDEQLRRDGLLVYLDDYAAVFAQEVGLAGRMDRLSTALADLMYIVPDSDAQGARLTVLVSEAKFLGSADTVAAELARSERQLTATMQKLSRIFGPEPAVDQAWWLAMMGNLVVETAQKRPGMGFDPEVLAWHVRRGAVKVALEGHSHIFVTADEDKNEWSRLGSVPDTWRGVIGRRQIAGMLSSLIGRSPVAASAVMRPPAEAKPVTRPEAVHLQRRPSEVTLPAASQPTPQFPWAIPEVSELLPAITDELRDPQTDEDVAKELEHVQTSLREFLPRVGIPASFGESTVTPNAFRVRLKGQVGLNPSSIEKLRDQFTTVKGLRLIRVEPEPGYLALSFRRSQRGVVTYLSCLENREVSANRANTKVLLGRREDNGAVVYFDFGGEDPHALIGGMSNSGKSQLLRMMILDMALSNSPDHLHLILVDPKQVEFQCFRNLPHLHPGAIVTTKSDANTVLNGLVTEMDRRYGEFANRQVNEIKKYHQIPHAPLMRRMVIVFDEFADWMLDDDFKRTVNDSLQRLAGKARAAGIHLILSTQRPDNSVVTPILRANLGAKIALRVDKKANSEIILDETGAQHLLGQGHGLARLAGERVLFQAAFVPDQVLDTLLSRMGVSSSSAD
jgi:S-DNA-T family DNA segregation ATPase FtsK/SpoIIIE